MRLVPLFVAALAAALPASAESQAPQPAAFSYADLADLSLQAPIAAHVRVARARLLKGDSAAGVAADKARFYVEAEVVSLIRSAQPLPARVSYVVDLPRNAKGKAPKLAKKSEFILLASPVAGYANELRLVAPDAQIPYTPAAADRVRAIRREASGAGAPPRITGIGRAFHVPGAIAGESETQIFLQTAEGLPVSLNVLRRPGQTPQWAVALGEIVDEAAGPPQRDTLLWYRLACTLPRALPPQSLAEAEPGTGPAIEDDYRLIIERLGPCVRTRRPR
jgi:hypothetical protein